jgi:hypothetical protein
MEAEALDGRAYYISIYASCLWARLSKWLARYALPVTIFITVQQAVGTLWFWGTNVSDQLHATGIGENTATWLGGGLVFLSVTAYLQWRVTRLLPTRSNKLVLGIQIASALGNAIALGIFAYRRWAWTPSDTLCAVGVAVIAVIALAAYCRKHSHYTYKDNMRHLIVAGWVMALLAIELRGVPRVFQAGSLLVNNPMTLGTVLSGIYIAFVRLMAVGMVTARSSSHTARQAFYIELFGNLGSQVILAVGWALARQHA